MAIPEPDWAIETIRDLAAQIYKRGMAVQTVVSRVSEMMGHPSWWTSKHTDIVSKFMDEHEEELSRRSLTRAKKIFAEGTTLDELVGLGILAGMITVEPERRLDPTFQEALRNTADLCGCRLGEYASKAAKETELDGEIARLAARELANDCVKVYLTRTAEFLVETLA